MRISIAAILVVAISSIPEAIAEAALSPGKPAGIRRAMSTSEKTEMYVIAGVVLISTGAAIALIGRTTNTAATSTNPWGWLLSVFK
jgi:hypothetical protein